MQVIILRWCGIWKSSAGAHFIASTDPMPQRLRVLFAIGSLAGGGSERQLVNILRYLDRTRFQPLLYLVDRAGELLDEVPDDVPIFSYWPEQPHPRRNFPGRIHRAQVQHFRHVLAEQRPDVVYDRNWFMTMISGRATRAAGVPRLSVIVNEPVLDLGHASQRFFWLKRRLLQRAYQDAFRVVAVSETVRESALRYYHLSPDQVVTVPNFMDLERIDRIRDQEVSLESERFHIAAIGRLQTEKGHGTLLQALRDVVTVRQHRQLMLHILGQGPRERELREYVRSQHLSDHVQFHGFVANPLAIVRRSQLFCLPSLWEGMPNALLEAMACEVPVLASDCPGGVREVLDGGRLGRLVPPADAVALADAIEDALLHYADWRSMTGPARKHVEAAYSPQAGLAQLEPLLQSASEQ